MIAAVVVTYSAPAAVLDRCLRSLVRAGGLDRIVVVDTGGSAVVAPDLADGVTLDRMENRGYGAAANRGFELLPGAGLIALLNDDVVVTSRWLAPLVSAIAEDRVGATQPLLIGSDGATVTSAGVRIDAFGAGSDIGDGESADAWTGGPSALLEIFNGGTVLFDAEFLADTGGFDERYFMYYEDVDLALRGARLGWSYRLAPTSVVEHERGTSSSALGEQTRFRQERNRVWTAVRFAPPATVAGAFGLSLRRLRHEPRAVHRRALLAGAAGAPRRLVERSRGAAAR